MQTSSSVKSIGFEAKSPRFRSKLLELHIALKECLLKNSQQTAAVPESKVSASSDSPLDPLQFIRPRRLQSHLALFAATNDAVKECGRNLADDLQRALLSLVFSSDPADSGRSYLELYEHSRYEYQQLLASRRERTPPPTLDVGALEAAREREQVAVARWTELQSQMQALTAERDALKRDNSSVAGRLKRFFDHLLLASLSDHCPMRSTQEQLIALERQMESHQDQSREHGDALCVR